MNNYKTPEFNVIRFDVNGSTMDGYADGDVGNNPWEELFTEEGPSMDEPTGTQNM